MVAPIRLIVLPSASGNGLLCSLKNAVSQLLDTGVDVLAVIKVKFSAQHVSQFFRKRTSLPFYSSSWNPSER